MKLPKTQEKALVAELLVLLSRPEEWQYDRGYEWKHASGVEFSLSSYSFHLNSPTYLDFRCFNGMKLKRALKRVIRYIHRKDRETKCEETLQKLGRLVPSQDAQLRSLDYDAVGGDAPEKGAWMN